MQSVVEQEFFKKRVDEQIKHRKKLFLIFLKTYH